MLPWSQGPDGLSLHLLAPWLFLWAHLSVSPAAVPGRQTWHVSLAVTVLTSRDDQKTVVLFKLVPPMLHSRMSIRAQSMADVAAAGQDWAHPCGQRVAHLTSSIFMLKTAHGEKLEEHGILAEKEGTFKGAGHRSSSKHTGQKLRFLWTNMLLEHSDSYLVCACWCVTSPMGRQTWGDCTSWPVVGADACSCNPEFLPPSICRSLYLGLSPVRAGGCFPGNEGSLSLRGLSLEPRACLVHGVAVSYVLISLEQLKTPLN